MRPKVIIYDFDGTIGNTLEEAVRIYNEIAAENKYRSIDGEDIPALRDMGLHQVMEALHIQFYKLPWIMGLVRMRLKASIPRLNAYPGIPELLKDFRRKGYRQGIVTSNSEENVRLFLEHNEIPEIEFVFSETSILGKGRVLKDLLARESLKPEETVYVGDEARDAEAARENGIPFIGVTWGANSSAALTKAGAGMLADSPEQLAMLLP